MPLAVISLDTSLQAILDQNSFSLGELSSHTLASPFVPKFDAFQTQWFTVQQARTNLVIAAGKAEGAVHGADDALDDFVDTLDRTLLIAVKNDRRAPLYANYFGLKPPHLLKRPILGEELATCRAWLPSLQTSTIPAVAALAPALATLVATADSAVAQQIAADQALRDFDTIGDKKTLVDGYNALRKSTYGDLAAMPHQNPTAMLPPSFADRFFRHDAHAGVTSLTNPQDVQARIDSLHKDMTVAQQHLADLNAQAEAKVAQKKAEADADAAVAVARAAETAARQKVKDAQKAAKDARKKPPVPPATPPVGAPQGK